MIYAQSINLLKSRSLFQSKCFLKSKFFYIYHWNSDLWDPLSLRSMILMKMETEEMPKTKARTVSVREDKDGVPSWEGMGEQWQAEGKEDKLHFPDNFLQINGTRINILHKRLSYTPPEGLCWPWTVVLLKYFANHVAKENVRPYWHLSGGNTSHPTAT